ncbi:MAG: hypothetical protein MUF25_07875 [Pirellulaceae bacterium]|nr:hypothetical protein [Pirellulaceae bacterium]
MADIVASHGVSRIEDWSTARQPGFQVLCVSLDIPTVRKHEDHLPPRRPTMPSEVGTHERA